MRSEFKSYQSEGQEVLNSYHHQVYLVRIDSVLKFCFVSSGLILVLCAIGRTREEHVFSRVCPFVHSSGSISCDTYTDSYPIKLGLDPPPPLLYPSHMFKLEEWQLLAFSTGHICDVIVIVLVVSARQIADKFEHLQGWSVCNGFLLTSGWQTWRSSFLGPFTFSGMVSVQWIPANFWMANMAVKLP